MILFTMFFAIEPVSAGAVHQSSPMASPASSPDVESTRHHNTGIRQVVDRSLARADEQKKAPPIVQQAVMVADKGPYRLKMTRYVCCTRPPFYNGKIEKAVHKVRLRVYRLKERVHKWNYFFLSMDADRKGKKTRTPVEDTSGSWMSYIAWTPHKSKSTAYTRGRDATDNDCKRYPLNIGASFYGMSAGTRVASVKMCEDDAHIEFEQTKSTAGRGGHWTAYAPRSVKRAEFRKFIKVKRGHRPKFKVRLGAHCDYIHRPTHDPVTKKCYDYHTVRY